MLLILLLLRLVGARWDLITTIHVAGGGGEGNWTGNVFCPDGSWARGYRHYTNTNSGTLYDDKGTYFVELQCFNIAGAFVSAVQSCGEDLGDGGWSSVVYCSKTLNFIKGYRLKVETSCCAVTGVRMSCTLPNEYLDAGREYHAGGLQSWGDCPAGTALCGLDSKFLGDQGAGDDTALNDIKGHCCRLCDEDTARFVNTVTLNCDPCHYTCKKCSGANNNQCTECFYSESVTSGSCPSPSCNNY